MAAADRFGTQRDPNAPGATWPLSRAAAVTPSDTVDLTNASRCLYVGVTGDLTVDFLEGPTAVLIKAAAVGYHWIRVTRVRATGTAATNIVALD